MKGEIAIIKDGKIFRVEAPPEIKILHGDRALNVNFDLVSVDGEMYLARHVLEMASKGEKGFRLIGFDLLPSEET